MYFWILFTLSMFVGLVSQVLLVVPFFGGDVYMPMLTGLVVYYALQHNLLVGCTAALLGGLLADAFSMGQAGTWLAYYSLVVYLASRFKRQIVPDAAVTAAVFGMAANLAIAGTHFLLLLASGHRSGTVVSIVARLLWSVGSAALLTPLLCVLMHKLYKGLDLIDREEGQHVNA